MNYSRSKQVLDALRGADEPLTIPQIIERMQPIEGDESPINRDNVGSTLFNLKKSGKVENGHKRFCKGSKWLSTWRLTE